MYCPVCGAWNPEESKFCGKCGSQFAPAQRERGAPRRISTLAIATAALVVLAICLSTLVLRDRLSRAWQSFLASPSATPTAVATQATPAPTISATTTAAAGATDTASPTVALAPTATPSATPQPTAPPTARPRAFKVVYQQCIPHGQSLGSVKGQVFDGAGKVIVGARVRITINGYEWNSDANPARTNQDGWYEWILEPGQKVQFVELLIGDQSVAFSPVGFEVEARGGCFQRVDFVEG